MNGNVADNTMKPINPQATSLLLLGDLRRLLMLHMQYCTQVNFSANGPPDFQRPFKNVVLTNAEQAPADRYRARLSRQTLNDRRM